MELNITHADVTLGVPKKFIFEIRVHFPLYTRENLPPTHFYNKI